MELVVGIVLGLLKRPLRWGLPVRSNGVRRFHHGAKHLGGLRLGNVDHALQLCGQSPSLSDIIEAAVAKGILDVIADLQEVCRDRSRRGRPGRRR